MALLEEQHGEQPGRLTSAAGTPRPFTMPSLGADMDAGTLTEWHIKPGAHVKRGDIVALVETEKGIIEIEIWDTGVVDEILVSPGTKVPVGTVLATIRDEGSDPRPRQEPAPAPPASPPLLARPAEPEHVRASPAARQLARELDVDLATVHGTGPHEAITRGDVLRIEALRKATHPDATSKAPEPAPIITKAAPTISAPPLPGRSPSPAAAAMRKAIAAAMARSKREIPHYYLGQDIDVTAAEEWLQDENAKRPVTERVLFSALLLKATALALAEVPELNGFFVDGEFRPASGVHIGVAISLRHNGGLIAPALHDTNTKSLVEIMKGLSDLVSRARAGTLRSSEMSDPTITVTHLGDLGADLVYGVIYPPQVAIVGFGTTRERPWAKDGMLGVRSIVHATLAADHRVSDGHRGARFLAVVEQLLTHPSRLA